MPDASATYPPRAADRIRASANIVFAVAQALASQITAVMGVTDIGTRSDQSPALFTPPDFTFAIWGLIFPAMLAYSVYQTLPRNLTNPALRSIGWWTAAAMALNAGWELVTVETGVSFATVPIIFAMLAALMAAFRALNRGGTTGSVHSLLVTAPVSIFAGWITVASIANTSSWLGNGGGFDGGPLPDAVWVAILAVVGAAVGALVMGANRANAYYAGVLVWAFGGIVYKGLMLSEWVMVVGAATALCITLVAYGVFGRAKTVA